MPPADSAALIVARFLKAHQYSESFAAFIAEAGLPDSAGTTSRGDLTLETLLDEKKTFDVALKFEKLGIGGDGGDKGWRLPAPQKGAAISSLPTPSNILSTAITDLSIDDSNCKVLIISTADRRLHILDLPSLMLRASHSALSDAPILSCTPLSTRTLLCTTMSGSLLAIDAKGNLLDKRKDHSKYVVACAVHNSAFTQGALVATAGWDNKVHVYRPSSPPGDNSFAFGDPIATLPLPTKPESILFISHPDTQEPIIILSRTDSSFIYYYTLPTATSTGTSTTLTELGKQNLAPHSNAWVAFTPSSLALHPSDPTLLAVSTNSIPHMKVLLVRLLIPPINNPPAPRPIVPNPMSTALSSLLDPVTASPQAPPQETQASQARAALAVADREHAAIVLHVNTSAPQTAYSTPCIVWRPDGSGVWVNGDDGVVRGVETKTGKVVARLGQGEGGHEAGVKVRCLGSGTMGDGDGEEVLVSGGFDQRAVVWRCEDT